MTKTDFYTKKSRRLSRFQDCYVKPYPFLCDFNEFVSENSTSQFIKYSNRPAKLCTCGKERAYVHGVSICSGNRRSCGDSAI